MRVKLTISYDGSAFFGSQIQKHTDQTVMGTLQKALLHLGIEEKVVASGRTDTGVHATSQVCHLDLPPYWVDTQKLLQRLNTILPSSIYIKKLTQASPSFHARFDAKSRSYRYILTTTRPTPFSANYVTWVEKLDFEKLQQNMQLFKGTHDFEYFQKTGSDVASTTRTIYRSFAYRYKNYTILHFQANGFLRSQVRLMCAAALQLEKQHIQSMLIKDRRYKLKPASPNGLYLNRITYRG